MLPSEVVLVLDLLQKPLVSGILTRLVLTPDTGAARPLRAQLAIGKLHFGDADTDWLVVDMVHFVDEFLKTYHVSENVTAFDLMFFGVTKDLGGVDSPKIDFRACSEEQVDSGEPPVILDCLVLQNLLPHLVELVVGLQ